VRLIVTALTCYVGLQVHKFGYQVLICNFSMVEFWFARSSRRIINALFTDLAAIVFKSLHHGRVMAMQWLRDEMPRD
jgi:hypothetical protein